MIAIIKQAAVKRVVALIMMVCLTVASVFSVAAFAKTVTVTDGDKLFSVTTIKYSTEDILEAADIEVGKYDKVIRNENNGRIFINIIRAAAVTVEVDGKKHKAVLTGQVKDALKKVSVTLDSDDRVTPSADKEIYSGMEITVSRFDKITICVDNNQITVSVPHGTVGQALDYLNIEYGEDDALSDSPDTETKDDMIIYVSHCSSDEATVFEDVSFETVKEYTDSMYEGETKVKTEGVNGSAVCVYRQKRLIGEVLESELISREIVTEPVNEVILVGTKEKVKLTEQAAADVTIRIEDGKLLDPDGNEISYSEVLYGSGTAYYAEPGACTATGVLAYKGGVAVNPNIIPYGSKLYVVSQDGSFVYGYATAVDTGGALMDGSAIVDCYYPTYDECVVFGRRDMAVYVLD